MEHMLNKWVKEIEISGIRKFANMVSKYDNVISLTLGQPDFNTPEHIKIAAIKAIENNKTGYTPNPGLIELRQNASMYYLKKYGLKYDPESEIIVTSGATEGIDAALRTILEIGDEVIIPGPSYPGYEPIVLMCGAKPKYIDIRKSNFKITGSMLLKAITDKTKCIILPSPSNPTGVSLSKEDIEEICDVIKNKDIFILSDEIYSELIYEGKHESIAAYENMRDKTIVINGLSKSHSMTGWRIGFVFAPENISKHILKVHQYTVTCASSISQYAALEAVKEGFSDSSYMLSEYKKRRDYSIMRLKNMGFDLIKPNGAFYLFPSIKKFSLNSYDFALSLLKEAHVAVVPGSAFSSFGEDHIRISYASSMENLKEAFDRIEGYITSI